MRYLVDGHNALHALRISAADHGAERLLLLETVRTRTRRAIVFFDGFPPPGEFVQTETKGVAVRFSERREADEAIVELVRDDARPARLTVVTDDLGLARRVEQMGAHTARIRDFFRVGVRETEDKPRDAGGFTASDFGLPDEIDLDTPQ